MSTQAAPAPARRHAFSWPPGSIRALLVLIVVALVCALLLIGYDRQGQPIPIPAYLLYLLFLAIGYYFAARGNSQVQPGVAPPLWLPRGSIRLLIIAALTATVVYRISPDGGTALEEQMRASIKSIEAQPILPLVILGGLFLGVIVRAVVIGRNERSVWAQNLEAWFALIAVLLMAIATIIHLVINPSLLAWHEMPHWEGFLGAVVAFYFGIRS